MLKYANITKSLIRYSRSPSIVSSVRLMKLGAGDYKEISGVEALWEKLPINPFFNMRIL